MTRMPVRRLPSPREHVTAVVAALCDLDQQLDQVEAWGQRLTSVLQRGGCVLTCGDREHGTAASDLADELRARSQRSVGPFATIPLGVAPAGRLATADGWCDDVEGVARQVLARGRPGDVLLPISTTGRTDEVLAAARAARQRGLHVLAFTGPAPNPLADLAHETVRVDAGQDATIREVHGTLVRALCASLDRTLARRAGVVTAEPARLGTGPVQPGPRRPRVSEPPAWPDAASS